MLHYYLELGNRAAEQDALNALNKNARFWNDYNYAALKTVIIFLGKIFDPDANAFSLSKLFNSVKSNLSHFSRDSLKRRKVSIAVEFEGLDEYLADAHELGKEDTKLIKQQIREARIIWKKIEPLRNKIYAHDEMLPEEEKTALFANTTYIMNYKN